MIPKGFASCTSFLCARGPQSMADQATSMNSPCAQELRCAGHTGRDTQEMASPDHGALQPTPHRVTSTKRGELSPCVAAVVCPHQPRTLQPQRTPLLTIITVKSDVHHVRSEASEGKRGWTHALKPEDTGGGRLMKPQRTCMTA